jgi:hypothetical protein
MVWKPVSTMPASLEKSANPAGVSPTRQYVTKADWHDGDWVMKKGATIAFRADGLGSFSGRLYTVRPARNQELHFQSVQYGRDGNLLFAAPAADLGHAIHARSYGQDYPVDFNFGYDARQFPYIERVLFTARIRQPKGSTSETGAGAARDTGK